MEVCIIGGGFCGIGAAKQSLDHGLVPFIICKSSAPRGLWNGFSNEIGVWDSMRTNACKWLTTFSDQPWKSEDPDFPSASQVRDYLNGYIEKHGLHQYFHFNSTVIEVSRHGEDYLVRWKEGENVQESVFKYVLVASGRCSKDQTPVQRPELFTGKIVQGSGYRDLSVFQGRKVLVVGRSFTSSDISVEALKVAESVTQVYTGRPYLVIRRYCLAIPSDFLFNSHMALSAPTHIIQTLESNIAQNKMLMSIFGNPSAILPEWEIPECPTHFIRSVLYQDEYIDAVSSKRIPLVKGKVEEFYSEGVRLSDGTEIEADVVVLGTGYFTDYSFLSEEIRNIIQYREDDSFLPAALYRSIMHPALPGISFAGLMAGPHTGRYELPVEIGIRFMLGKLSITEEELWQGVRDEEFIRENLRDQYTTYAFTDYLRELIRILDIKIDMEFIKNELEFCNGPLIPQMFWLEKTGQIEIAKQAIADIKARFPQYQFN